MRTDVATLNGLQHENVADPVEAAIGAGTLGRSIGIGPQPSARCISEDRRMTSIHEAGHYVVARHFKVSGSAWIEPLKRKYQPDQKLWAGKFQYASGAFDRLSEIRRQMVASAGTVAEECWMHRFNPDIGFGDWSFDIWDIDWMSQSDWRLAGNKPGWPSPKLLRATEAVHGLLAPGKLLWPQLLEASRLLISRGEIG